MAGGFGEVAQQEYHCLKCNATHYNTEDIYHEHIILHKSKEGIKPHQHKFKSIQKTDEWQRKRWYVCVCGAKEYK